LVSFLAHLSLRVPREGVSHATYMMLPDAYVVY
jgi:hypothetical protein